MKTLNDKITFSRSFTPSTTDRNVVYTIGGNGVTIFQGSVFVPKSNVTQTIEICLNDILKSEIEKIEVLEKYNPKEYNPIRTYTITIEGQTYSLGEIFLGYFSPIHKYSVRNLQSASTCASTTWGKQLSPMIQGVNNYLPSEPQKQKFVLYPRYPFVLTDQLRFAQLFNVGSAHEDINYGFTDGDELFISGGFAHNNYVDNLSVKLEDFIDVYPYKKDIVLTSSAVGTEKKITGKKLWIITVEDQYMYSDPNTHEFANELGYDAFYCTHFYIQQPNGETLYFIYETNDPENDIVKKAEATIKRQGFRYTYEELSSVTLYYPKMFNDSGWQGDELYMEDICNSILNITLKEAESWGLDRDQYNKWLIYKKYRLYKEEQCIVFSTYLSKDPKSTKYGEPYSEYFDVDGYDTESSSYQSTYKEEYVPAPIKIAEFDECPAKYYLQWIDRYKGVQCQPFYGKSTVSISYNVQNITNRYNAKRPALFDNTYSFDLNTGWLTEEQYPLFESIFVSPSIRLYDTENDLGYDVIVTDKQFVEKTRANQKKMFGFNIKLQINTTENIIY